MKPGFSSHQQEFSSLLNQVVPSPLTHAAWLNTLSYLESCGARKIALFQHPQTLTTEILKHATEESRHAYFLRMLANRVLHMEGEAPYEDYRLENMLGGITSKHYLHKLDLYTSALLSKDGQLSGRALKDLAYILVTYAIELRAQDLYPLYQDLLQKYVPKVSVRALILEEEEHLAEMEEALEKHPRGSTFLTEVLAYESKLNRNWIRAVQTEVDACQKTELCTTNG